jgi:hypothetical protein
MSVVALPDVTIIVVDSVEPGLVRLAIEDTLREIEPAEVMVFTDTFRPIPGAVTIDRPAYSFGDVTKILWYDAPRFVNTSHFLVMQWDGWVVDGSRWNPNWLSLDYVGAPWDWHDDGFNVGNGGFSLRSTELFRWMSERRSNYPIGHPEDVELCRTHRRELELDGFTWATVNQAEEFSFERSFPRSTFGFHGAWNWPHVMDRDRLLTRLETAGDYARGKPEWRELMSAVGVLGSAPSLSPLTRTLSFFGRS